MLKDVIVNLALGAKNDPAADYAVSIGETFDAHITGIAFILKPVMPNMIIESPTTNVIHSAINRNERPCMPR